jgi:hypothetical protein
MDLRLSKAVEKVILIRRDESGRDVLRTVYRRSERRKSSTGPLRMVGSAVRKIIAAQEAAARTYLDRHDRSNREKSDGWLRDLTYNVYRATRRGLKKVQRTMDLPTIDD